MFQFSTVVIPGPSNLVQNCHYGSYQFFCSTCKQRFLSEKSFRRHNKSRKHQKKMQLMHGFSNSCRSGGVKKMQLLQNDVFKALVFDLSDEIQKKDEFFNGIELLNDWEIDLVDDSEVGPFRRQSCKPNNENNSDDDRHKQLDLAHIPATYPCLTCFKLLDSQKHFNEHMLKVHFGESRNAV